MSTEPTQQKPATGPVELHRHAADNLSFIRETMERSASFTAVPGWGTVGMGVLALAGACVAALRLGRDWWIWTWVVVAAAAFILGSVTLRIKARRVRVPVWTGPGRRFAMSLAPPILAGALLTAVLYLRGLDHLMPGMWLLLYGVGVFAGGTFSVRIIPLMGLCFALPGAALSLLPDTASQFTVIGPMTVADVFLAAGFGGLQIVFGAIIAKKYGG